MKLLICTQIIDTEHPILGFFHRWVDEFAKHCDSVHVICLKEGRHDLPENVHVHSLGKEKGGNRLLYILRFYKYSWKLRKEYDTVFVHMNPEYTVLMGVVWRFFWSMPVLQWHNHKVGPIWAKLAALIAHHVLYTSGGAHSSRYKKALQMPVGIDTDNFSPTSSAPASNTFVYVGRLSPVKKVDVMLEAFKVLDNRGVKFFFDIVAAEPDKDAVYVKKIKEPAKDIGKSGTVRFLGEIAHADLPNVLQSYRYLLNLTDHGSFDKVLLEASATGTIPIALNENLHEILPGSLQVSSLDPEILADVLEQAIQSRSDPELVKSLRNWVINKHSLSQLVELVCEYANKIKRARA